MAVTNPVPQIAQIKLSEEERISGIPYSLTIEQALDALHRDGMFLMITDLGIVVLNNAVYAKVPLT